MEKMTLRELRKSKNLTLQQLSELSGITTTELSFIERGKNKPRPANIRKLATAFGLTYEEVFDMFY